MSYCGPALTLISIGYVNLLQMTGIVVFGLGHSGILVSLSLIGSNTGNVLKLNGGGTRTSGQSLRLCSGGSSTPLKALVVSAMNTSRCSSVNGRIPYDEDMDFTTLELK